MKMKKVLILLLTCVLTCSVGTPVLATTQDEIAAAQAQKQEAQAGLAQTQANISSLESKKQELESYLAELDAQRIDKYHFPAQCGGSGKRGRAEDHSDRAGKSEEESGRTVRGNEAENCLHV